MEEKKAKKWGFEQVQFNHGNENEGSGQHTDTDRQTDTDTHKCAFAVRTLCL